MSSRQNCSHLAPPIEQGSTGSMLATVYPNLEFNKVPSDLTSNVKHITIIIIICIYLHIHNSFCGSSLKRRSNFESPPVDRPITPWVNETVETDQWTVV